MDNPHPQFPLKVFISEQGARWEWHLKYFFWKGLIHVNSNEMFRKCTCCAFLCVNFLHKLYMLSSWRCPYFPPFKDLIQVQSGQLAHHLKKIIAHCTKHVYKCKVLIIIRGKRWVRFSVSLLFLKRNISNVW